MICSNLSPDNAAIVSEFAYLTVCMEGKDIFDCLDGYARRHGSGFQDEMGCYFAEELDIKDPDRINEMVMIYYENKHGVVQKIHLTEEQFYNEFVKALNRAAFLFDEEEWQLIQYKLVQLKSVLANG